MYLRRIIILGFALLFQCNSAWCSSLIRVNVVQYGIYGNGNVWVTLDRATDQDGCATPYLEFPANAPTNRALLSIAALAVATGRPIVLQIDGCMSTGSNGAGTFTGIRNSTAFGLAPSK